jgi:hypothetical protein
MTSSSKGSAGISNSGTVSRGEHTAQFEVVGKTLTVTSVLGTKQAQLGKTPPEALAKLLLAEQIIEARRSDLKRDREGPRMDEF